LASETDSNHHFYVTTDQKSGFLLFKKISRTVHFSADDFDEFSAHFQRMVDELKLWQEQYGRKAVKLDLVIEAHPWILKRVRDHLSHAYPLEHPYGDLARKHPISIHVYDPLDRQGNHYLFSNDGLSPVKPFSSDEKTPNA
jgi:hypothetical protein